MADGVPITAGSGTTVATDDISGEHYQRVKLIHGANGVNAGDVSTANGLPVQVVAGTANIGDVDVLSVIPGTSATSLGKAEDAAHASGDTGVMVLGVRSDAQTALAADGDYIPLMMTSTGRAAVHDSTVYDAISTLNTALIPLSQAAKTEDSLASTGDFGMHTLTVRKDTAVATAGASNDYQSAISNATGALWVAIENGSGGQITSFGGGTQYTEDAAAAADPVGTANILVRADTPTATVSADGDNIAQRGGNFGNAYVTLVDNAGAFLSVGGGTQYTEDAAAAANPVGNAIVLVRADTPGATVSADGDNVALRGGNFGNAYVTLVDNAGSFLAVGGGTQYDEDTAHVSGDKVTMAGVVRADTAAALSGTDGDRTALITDASGRLHTNVGIVVPGTAATNLGKAVDSVAGATDTGVAMLGKRVDTLATITPAIGDYAAVLVDNVGNLRVFDEFSNIALSGLDTLLSTTATNTGVIAGAVKAEDVASAGGDPGIVIHARRTDTPGSTSGTDGDYEAIQISAGRVWTSSTVTGISAGSALIGDVGIQGRTTGGLTTFLSIDLDETEEEIKATAGTVYAIHVVNLHASSVRFLKIYNDTAANVTVGSSTPTHVFPIPAGPAGFTWVVPQGIAFGTAITAAATTGVAHADTGAPGANEVVINIEYK